MSITNRVIDINSFRQITAYMDDGTDWLNSVGETQRIYDDMMSDSRIGSLIEDRKNQILLLNSSLTDSPNKNITEMCKKYIPFNLILKISNSLLNAIPYGIALGEIVWQRKDMLYIPADFIPIPRRAIFFLKTNEAYNVPHLVINNIPLDDQNKILIHRKDDGEASAWGDAVLRKCYWAWKFKKLGFKFWILAAEKIGVPSVYALFETRNSEEAKTRAQELSEVLQEMESASGAAFGNITDLKILESNINNFDVIINTCNSEISYAITGQSLATNQSEYGTKAQASVHEKTYEHQTIFGSYQLQNTIQKIYDAFVRINFPGEQAPLYDIDNADYAPWSMVREMIDRGVPVSRRKLYEKYLAPEPESEKDIFLKDTPNDFYTDRSDFFFQT